MNWWHRLLDVVRGPGQADGERWVVVDVESSGLDPGRDRLLAIAGLAVSFRQGEPRLELADSFEATLRQDDGAASGEVDKSNILLHGIGVGAQRGGVPYQEGLQTFSRWAGAAPIIAYHAAFDRTLIQRHCRAHLGRRLSNAWLDLEHVVVQLVPGLPDRSLDSAMSHLGISCPKRHDATADTLATAEILLRIWPLARAQMDGRSDFTAIRRLAAGRRWLGGQGAGG